MSTSVLIAGWSPTPQVVVDAGLKQAPCTEVHVVLEQGGEQNRTAPAPEREWRPSSGTSSQRRTSFGQRRRREAPQGQ